MRQALPVDFAVAIVIWMGSTAFAGEALTPDADLASTGPPSLLQAPRIAKKLRSRDVAIRESAIARLRPYPKESTAAVMTALRDGNLQSRLAALDLLGAWKAPTAGLDPWMPETFTKERLDALDTWSRALVAGPPPPSWAPTEEDLAAAARDMEASLTASAVEAAAIRERLARFGLALMPQVLAKLATVEDEAWRERLYALRYRLATSPGRALSWPGGIERLASRDLKERRQAIDELVKSANSDDEALLSELVSHPDPLVRELALRGLQAASGEAASVALVKMLADPEPNVRAAVLKQWAEKPAASMLPELEKYLATETSPDLIVHAVRVLRELGTNAIPLLVTLTKHEAWQVRAEAGEALAKAGEGSSFVSHGRDEDHTDAVQEAFLDLLDDDDSYVASRGVEGLRGADLPKAVKPLLALAEARPELAPAAIAAIAAGENARKAAETDLRKLVKHASPDVRMAALSGLVQNEEIECDAEILQCLEDDDAKVRISAAGAVTARAQEARREAARAVSDLAPPPAPVSFLSRLFGRGSSPAVAPPEAVKPATADANQPPALPKETPHTKALRRMAAAADAKEATAGGLALAATGFAAEVQDRLESLVEADPSLIPEVSGVLSLLDPEPRTRLFRRFIRLDPEEAVDAADSLVDEIEEPDAMAADLMWEVCRDPRLSAAQARSVVYSLLKASLGSDWHDASRADRARLCETARDRCRRGRLAERMVALELLGMADVQEALAACNDVLNADSILHDDLVATAYRMILRGASVAESKRAILWGLESKNPMFVQPAIAALAEAWDIVGRWKNQDGEGIYAANSISSSRREEPATAENPFDPAKPEGLTLEHLKPLAQSTDPVDIGLVTYFRILLDDSTDIDPLIRLWESSPDDTTLRRLLTRAVAYIDDESLIPVLDRVFKQMMSSTYEWQRDSSVKDFYWTIRIMNGPEAAAFRKRVRDESGISLR